MTVDATALGFKRSESDLALAIIEAANAPDGAFMVAMDLARFVQIPLRDAASLLALGMNRPRRLRRLGFEVPDWLPPDEVLAVVRDQVKGQAGFYTETFYGSMDVREAQGHTFSAAFWRLYESVFGPRAR